MDWKLFAQLLVTVMVALAGGWLGHRLSARRDLLNERRKLRVTYLLEAYRRLEDGGNRSDPGRSWPQFESAIADIQLLGSPRQVGLARQFAHGMARDLTASLDDLINDLRQSLREELQLSAVEAPVVYLRFADSGPPRFDQTLTATIRDVDAAKAESAATASPDARRLLDQHERLAGGTAQIVEAWAELEVRVRAKLGRMGTDASGLGAAPLLQLALERRAITEIQNRSLRGLNVMRNLAVHGGDEINAARVQEFLALAEAMKAVLEITEGRGVQN